MWALLSTLAVISCSEVHELSAVVEDYPALTASEKGRILTRLREVGPSSCPKDEAPNGVAPTF